MQSRYYDPAIGRFINADSIDYLDNNIESRFLDLFAYCENNPSTYFDECGTWFSKRKIIGIGFQISLDGTIGWSHFFGGLEFIWYLFNGCKNFKAGIKPWIYLFGGFNISLTFDYGALFDGSIINQFSAGKIISITKLKSMLKQINAQNIVSTPSFKNYLNALGFTASLNVVFSLFIVTAKKFNGASDYEGTFAYKQRTVLGVTWSSGHDKENNVTTEGIGMTGTVSFPKLHFGLLTFGFGAGASNYKMLFKE